MDNQINPYNLIYENDNSIILSIIGDLDNKNWFTFFGEIQYILFDNKNGARI